MEMQSEANRTTLTLKKIWHEGVLVYLPTQNRVRLRLSEKGWARFMDELENLCYSDVVGVHELPGGYNRTVFKISETFVNTADNLFQSHIGS